LEDAGTEDFANADLAGPLVSRKRGKTEDTHTGYEDGDAHGDEEYIKTISKQKVLEPICTLKKLTVGEFEHP